MPRFIVRYTDHRGVPSITTLEAGSVSEAVNIQKRFCSSGSDFSAELITIRAAPESKETKDKRWPMLRKDD